LAAIGDSLRWGGAILELSIVAAEVAAKLSPVPFEELLWIEENVAA